MKEEEKKDETEKDGKTEKREINNGLGKPYYTQRNNKERPASACNVTSMIIALCAAGWPVEKFAPEGGQPEDELMKFIFTDPATLTKWRQLDPKGEIPPNQWHEVLAYAADRFLKKFGFNSSPVRFFEAVSVEDITAAIDAKGAAVISGIFPQDGKQPLNHIVAAVGYGTDDNGFYFIIDDPWGDYHTGYKNQRGKSIRMPLEDFNKIMKPQNQAKKWAHIVKKFGE